MYSNKRKTTVGSNLLVNEKAPNVDYKYGLYSSKEEAFEYLGEEGLDVLAVGLTVGIMTESGVEEYWFKSACDSVEDLVRKNVDDKILEVLQGILDKQDEIINRVSGIEEEQNEEWEEF